jgi:hypothetical protein
MRAANSAGPNGPTLELQTRGLLLVATLVARLAKKLAVLLLRHTLATLLDNGTHVDLTKVRGFAAVARRHKG